ncbi:hypothetical protein BS47DRAFT_260128 [Hydnum rufescens UP504]|uniref:Uncharacterized protein n=1 Tax=Hydnum rufescens UP504 TaxID=1448309 RepID=A0A9P6DXI3_9AGAM|nr:hypothetical protein BS47DRAFT_260128 [Hydnum rufescens UP504]
MGFLFVCLCNFAGTNIGATIVLCLVLQLWDVAQKPTFRTRDGAIHALALGANDGAFSASVSASLAGLLWCDILRRKLFYIDRRDFGRVNVPIVTIAMLVGCSILVGQIYIIKSNSPRT